ncbi:hypothetical protein CDAR_372481 [Caerostris darwini]|uniref:Uncharacterized protein n=1 Tax=Caerostris darwini TaxID=1538125 RepID=A0AAV4T9F0_9ARAC|nr:hypothetical protein CDAR_372481 [Caerostris darwini]
MQLGAFPVLEEAPTNHFTQWFLNNLHSPSGIKRSGCRYRNSNPGAINRPSLTFFSANLLFGLLGRLSIKATRQEKHYCEDCLLIECYVKNAPILKAGMSEGKVKDVLWNRHRVVTSFSGSLTTSTLPRESGYQVVDIGIRIPGQLTATISANLPFGLLGRLSIKATSIILKTAF